MVSRLLAVILAAAFWVTVGAQPISTFLELGPTGILCTAVPVSQLESRCF